MGSHLAQGPPTSHSRKMKELPARLGRQPRTSPSAPVFCLLAVWRQELAALSLEGRFHVGSCHLPPLVARLSSLARQQPPPRNFLYHNPTPDDKFGFSLSLVFPHARGYLSLPAHVCPIQTAGFPSSWALMALDHMGT